MSQHKKNRPRGNGSTLISPPPQKISNLVVKHLAAIGLASPHETARNHISHERQVHVVNPTSVASEAAELERQEDEMIAESTAESFAELEQRSKANTDYYESEALKDDCRKAWFHYPKHKYKYSEDVWVTPEMATELLNYNPGNRHISLSLIETYCSDILNNRWLNTHESLAIDTLGNMFDGQHRANAIKKAGKGCPVYITWNCQPEGRMVVDSGKKRSVNEKLSYVINGKISNRTAALCRSMMRGTNSLARFSELELAEFLTKHQIVILQVSQWLPQCRADVQAAVAKAMIWYGAERMKPFCEQLNTVEFTAGSPTKVLYFYLQKVKQQGVQGSPVVIYKKTLSAIDAFINNRELKAIHGRDEDIFEWLPSYEIPEIPSFVAE